jgi:hypothetical protein
VVGEIGQLRRGSVSREIIGSGAYDEAEGHQAADDQGRIRHRGHPKREVESLLDEIDHASRHRHIDRNLGILRRELRNGLGDLQRHRRRRVEPQRPARLRLQLLGGLLGVVDSRQDTNAAIVIGLTSLGHADASRGPIEQAHAESVLCRLNVQGDGARRHVEGARRASKAATVDHLHKRCHTENAVISLHRSSRRKPLSRRTSM